MGDMGMGIVGVTGHALRILVPGVGCQEKLPLVGILAQLVAVADIVGAFVSSEDLGNFLEVALPAILVFAIFGLIAIFAIPSKLKQDGFLSLRKLFVEYIIVCVVIGTIVGILMGAGIIPEDLESPIDSFVGACYAYKFFRCRNDLKEIETR